jgi:hypothetical protein
LRIRGFTAISHTRARLPCFSRTYLHDAWVSRGLRNTLTYNAAHGVLARVAHSGLRRRTRLKFDSDHSGTVAPGHNAIWPTGVGERQQMPSYRVNFIKSQETISFSAATSVRSSSDRLPTLSGPSNWLSSSSPGSKASGLESSCRPNRNRSQRLRSGTGEAASGREAPVLHKTVRRYRRA